MRLIDADKLKVAIKEKLGIYLDGTLNNRLLFGLIDNAQTVIYCSETSDGLPLMDLRPRPKGEYIDEDVMQIIKENFDIGYEMAKNKYERPKGEWKVYGKQGGIPITDICSNCRYEMKWYKNKYNFCPNCGADMRGGAE